MNMSSGNVVTALDSCRVGVAVVVDSTSGRPVAVVVVVIVLTREAGTPSEAVTVGGGGDSFVVVAACFFVGGIFDPLSLVLERAFVRLRERLPSVFFGFVLDVFFIFVPNFL
jgi:hypothetical protein